MALVLLQGLKKPEEVAVGTIHRLNVIQRFVEPEHPTAIATAMVQGLLGLLSRVIIMYNIGWLQKDSFINNYYPIIPMILVNGTEGIGTGYSTEIPPHNPNEIINNIENNIDISELQKKKK